MAADDRGPSGRRLRLDQPVPKLGSRRSRKVGGRRLRLRARRFAWHWPLAWIYRPLLAARNEGLLPLYRMVRCAAVVDRQGRLERHFLLRHQPVARGLTAAAT